MTQFMTVPSKAVGVSVKRRKVGGGVRNEVKPMESIYQVDKGKCGEQIQLSLSSLSGKRMVMPLTKIEKSERKSVFCGKHEFSLEHTELVMLAEHSHKNIYHSDLFSLV